MWLLCHQRSLLPNSCYFLALLPQVWLEKLKKLPIKGFSACEVSIIGCFYCMVNSYRPLQNRVWFAGGIVVTLFHTAPHTLSLIMERNCEQSHCAECMRPVFPVKQKALQWQRELQCSATIQPSCRQCGCPYTAAPPTLLLWQITPGRGAMPKIQQVLKEELETWTVWLRGWQAPGFTLVSAQDCLIHIWSYSRMCMFVCLLWIAKKTTLFFVRTRLVIYSRHSVINVLVIWVFCFLVAETVGSDSSKEQQLNDWLQ